MTTVSEPISVAMRPVHRHHLAELVEELNQSSTFNLCSIVTLVLLFMYAGTDWYLTVPMRIVSLCAIFLPRLRAKPFIWLLIVVLTLSANFYDRLLIDNHKYLMTYWCIAMFLASLQSDSNERDHALSLNGRLLVGICFFFAVISKIISPDYLSGDFFHYTMLIDRRFSNFAWLVGGVHRSTLTEMRSLIYDVEHSYLLGIKAPGIQLVSSPRFQLIVMIMTWWTIGIESLISLAFLSPWNNEFFDWCRRYLLWIFLLSTYSVALVPGFAWVLATLGLAQLPQRRSRYRIVYILIMAVVLQLYEIHWVSLVESFFDLILPGVGAP